MLRLSYIFVMEMDDDTLKALFKIGPESVPLTKVARCTRLLGKEDRKTLIRSLTKRRYRNDREREVLLHYAKSEGIGGVLFIDALGGFEGQRPN